MQGACLGGSAAPLTALVGVGGGRRRGGGGRAARHLVVRHCCHLHAGVGMWVCVRARGSLGRRPQPLIARADLPPLCPLPPPPHTLWAALVSLPPLVVPVCAESVAPREGPAPPPSAACSCFGGGAACSSPAPSPSSPASASTSSSPSSSAPGSDGCVCGRWGGHADGRVSCRPVPLALPRPSTAPPALYPPAPRPPPHLPRPPPCLPPPARTRAALLLAALGTGLGSLGARLLHRALQLADDRSHLAVDLRGAQEVTEVLLLQRGKRQRGRGQGVRAG